MSMDTKPASSHPDTWLVYISKLQHRKSWFLKDYGRAAMAMPFLLLDLEDSHLSKINDIKQRLCLNQDVQVIKKLRNVWVKAACSCKAVFSPVDDYISLEQSMRECIDAIMEVSCWNYSKTY